MTSRTSGRPFESPSSRCATPSRRPRGSRLAEGNRAIAIRRGAGGPPAGPRLGTGADGDVPATGAADGRGDHHGAREDRQRGRGDAARRVRLPAQAVHAGPGPGRPGAGRAVPEPPEPRGRPGGADRRRDPGSVSGQRRSAVARGPRAGAAGRRDRRGGPDPGRERDGKGRPGSGDPRLEPPCQGAVRHGQLPEPERRAARERPVRPRPRGVHGGRRGYRGQGRRGRGWDTLPRRDRRPSPTAPAQAAPLPPGTSLRARRRGPPPDGRRPPRRGDQSRPRMPRSPPASSARICCSASMSSS